MTTDELPDYEALAEIRGQVWRLGKARVVGAANETTAFTRAGHLTRKFPKAVSGLEFHPEEFEVDETVAQALGVKGGLQWAVYAYPAPLLTEGHAWTDDTDEAILEQLRTWGGRVLVRTYRSQNTNTTKAYLARQSRASEGTRLAEAGVTITSSTIGLKRRGAGSLFGVFALFRGAEMTEDERNVALS